jgi:hypothetical protein
MVRAFFVQNTEFQEVVCSSLEEFKKNKKENTHQKK